jgi:hypothetical protein
MRRIGFKAKVIVVNDALVALVAGAEDREVSSWSQELDQLPTAATRPVAPREPVDGGIC